MQPIKSFLLKLILELSDRNLMPLSMLPNVLRKKIIAKKVFYKKKLTWNDRGYWNISPLPSEQDLNLYYENNYWQSIGKIEGVFARDLDHFQILTKMISDLNKSKFTFLNFGAGHGGISHMMYICGHKVINVEPSGLQLNYNDNRWLTYKNIAEVNEKVDIIYGSHSLEHVSNLDIFEATLRKLAKPNSYIFWEVPNCENISNGGCNGEIAIPHTYYFTVDFFKNFQGKVLLNSTFNEKTFPNTPLKDNSGEVIRFLGQFF